jgi:carbonyl reductase 1
VEESRTDGNRARAAVVTGANQGLGLALAGGLAHALTAGDVVYLTGRNRERVDAAVSGVGDTTAQLVGRVLDVDDAGAVIDFAAEMLELHGGVDILFSNHYRRVLPDDVPAELIESYVETNNLGTTRVLRAFAPILRADGRLLVVASSLGRLRELPEHLWGAFDGDAVTLEDIDTATLMWRDEVLSGTAAQNGWPDFINIPSKVAQVAAVRAVARERRAGDLAGGRLVASVCPGMIDTGASRPWFDMKDAQTPAQAAVPLLDLALKPLDPAYYGELVRFGRVLSWP